MECFLLIAVCRTVQMHFIFIQVAANGLISFDSNDSLSLTPQPFPIVGFSYVAPYWFDNSIFTNHSIEVESTVYYRKITGIKSLFRRAAREVRRAFPNEKDFQPSTLLIATWNIDNPRRSHLNMVIS